MVNLISTPTPYVLYDLEGRFIEPGLVRQTLDWSPIVDTVLPSWMVTSDGSFTVNTAATGVPGVTIYQTGAPQAMVKLGGVVDRSKVVAARIRLRGVTSLGNTNVNQVLVRLDDTASPSDGVVLTSKCSLTENTLLMHRTGGVATYRDSVHRYAKNLTPESSTDPLAYAYRASNIGLLVNFEQGQIWGFEHDQVVTYQNRKGLITRTGTLEPRFTIGAQSASSLHIAGITLDLWYK